VALNQQGSSGACAGDLAITSMAAPGARQKLLKASLLSLFSGFGSDAARSSRDQASAELAKEIARF